MRLTEMPCVLSVAYRPTISKYMHAEQTVVQWDQSHNRSRVQLLLHFKKKFPVVVWAIESAFH